jgi:phage shock protein A
MAWLFRKLKDTISAKLNAILNSSVSPEEKVELADEKFREQIGYMQNAMAQLKTGRGIAAAKRDKIAADVKRMEADAKIALSKDREDLATQLVERMIPLRSNVASMDKTIENLDGRVKEMEKNFDNLLTQYNQFKAQKAELIGRFKAATAEKEAYGLITGIGTRMDDIKSQMSRTMDEVDELEAKATALRDMSGYGTIFDATLKDSVTQEVEKLRGSADVNDELARLKAEVGKK